MSTDPALYSIPADELGSVQIGDIKLSFREADGGGKHYRNRGHSEEYLSPFYPVLRAALDPQHCIDIGANYGYTGLLMRRAFPDASLKLVEPVPWLENYVRFNFAQNEKRFDQFFSAIASQDSGTSSFGVNTKATQDSRVKPQAGWDVVETRKVTLNDLAADVRPEEGVYIKIDTQGWEEHVFGGGATFLAKHNRWFVKTEFAPMWMESQESDPVEVLRDLVARYDVFESVGRVAWKSSSLDEILGHKLVAGEEEAFVEFVRNLALADKGWVDLFILPPESRRAYSLKGPGRKWSWRNVKKRFEISRT